MAETREAATLSLRISVTDECQLRCAYCAPPPGAPAPACPDALGPDEILDFVRIVKRRYLLRKIHVTGGEPLLRPDICDLVGRLARESPADLALTTNGLGLAEKVAALRQAGLARVNISLDSLDPQVYRRLTCGGDVAQAVAGIEAALAAGFEPIKLNMVVLGGINDGEVVRVVRYGLARGCQVRLLELMPIGVACARYQEWFVPTAEVRGQLEAHFHMEPLAPAPGASSRNWLARDGRGLSGVIGFISPCSDAFCAGCRRLRLTADGRLLGCLAQPDGADIRDLLAGPSAGREERLAAAIEEALASKRAGRRFAAQRPMISVGG
jgi:cyclic pyranopterin phosphate synthase